MKSFHLSIFSLLFLIFLPSSTLFAMEKQTDIDQNLEKIRDANQLDSLYLSQVSGVKNSDDIDNLLKVYRKSIKIKPLREDILDTIIHFSEKYDDLQALAEAYDRKGLNARYDSKFLESVQLHRRALGYFEQTTDSSGMMICLNNLAVVLRKLNHEQAAMQYYFRSLSLAQQLKNDRSEAISLNGIGNVFLNMGQYNKAIQYFRQVLAIETTRNNLKGINYDLSNIGEAFLLQGINDSALYYYQKSMEIGLQRNYDADLAVDYYNMGMVYQHFGDLEKSNTFFLQALDKFHEYQVIRYLSKTYIKLGENHIRQRGYAQALEYLEKGLVIGKEIQSLENIIEAEKSLSELYQLKQEFEKALFHYKNAQAITDSMKRDETKRNIAALETVYDSDLKDQEIKNIESKLKLQKSQNLLQILIIGFLIILFTIIIIFFRLKKKNNQLIINQMRNDIQDYVQRLKAMEQSIDKMTEVDERAVFVKNVEQFGLSEREIDVLTLISIGLKNDEIAEKLFLSVSTVKTHTRNIFQKLDVRNRIEAVRMARNNVV